MIGSAGSPRAALDKNQTLIPFRRHQAMSTTTATQQVLPAIPDRLPCPLCLKTFADGERLLSHGARRHAGVALQWTCAVCAKQYDDCQTWMRHRRRRHHQSDSAAAEEKAVDGTNAIAGSGSVFSCTDCDDHSYDSAERLDRHRQRRHLPNQRIGAVTAVLPNSSGGGTPDFQNVKCDDCGKCYSNDERLLRHRERRHAGVPSATVVDEPTSPERWQCDECEKRYASDERLGRHKQRRHGSGESSPEELEPVASVHDFEKKEFPVDAGISTRCHYCDKDFADSERLERHRRRKHRMRCDSPVRVVEQKPISLPTIEVPSYEKLPDGAPGGVVCNICMKSFVGEERLERHRARRHTDDNSELGGEKAVLVGQSTATECTGSNPVKVAVMENSDADLLSCDQCERSFTGLERLERHRKRKHVNGNRSIADVVGPVQRSKAPVTRSRPEPFQEIVIGLPDKGDLGQDILRTAPRILPRPKIHECKQCGKCYKSAVERELHHRRRHSGLPVYRCGICNYRCVDKQRILAHVAVHGGKRPFSCAICESTFKIKGDLTIHMRTHTGERPYKCPVCDKAFISSSNLATHRVFHSSERPFECAQCGSRFKLSGSLRRHQRNASICLHADALPRRNLEVMVASA